LSIAVAAIIRLEVLFNVAPLGGDVIVTAGGDVSRIAALTSGEEKGLS